eukprot:15364395-Ditylum_brightwellii.AAC.1
MPVDPILRILVNRRLQHMDKTNIKKRHPSLCWNAYQKLIKKQTEIGWEHLFFGQFGKEWQKAQQKYFKNSTLEEEEQKYDKYWFRKVILTIWNFWKTRWKARLSALYCTKDNKCDIKRQTLLQCIKTLHGKEEELLQQDRIFFKKMQDQWEMASGTDIQRLIRANQPFITQCLKLRKIQEKKQSRDIQEYYKRAARSRNSQEQKGEKKQINTVRKTVQKDIRQTFLGWDDKKCTDHNNKERAIQREITKYYKSQDKPLDNIRQATQISVKDFHGPNPNNNNHTAST